MFMAMFVMMIDIYDIVCDDDIYVHMIMNMNMIVGDSPDKLNIQNWAVWYLQTNLYYHNVHHWDHGEW